MFSCVRARLVCAALMISFTCPVHAGPLTLDLPTAVARARERAPEAIAALARIDETRGQRVGAEVLFTQNTEVQLGAGVRLGTPRRLALQAQVGQSLEPGRRRPRIAVADASIAHAEASREAELRRLGYEVATIFLEARFADLEVELARRGVEASTRAAEVAERRRKAGDLSDFDVNLARIALGRSRSRLAAAQSRRAEAVGRLGALVGARPDDAITLQGDLRPPPLTLESLRDALSARADVRELEAEARVARAERSLAVANGRPDLGLWFGYDLDETDTILVGGISLTLPLWNRAQGDKATARAKLRRAELERAAVIGTASRQLVDAFEAYTRARQAVEIFDREVVAALADSEQLLDRSLETGQVGMANYLALRNEMLSIRREHLERELELAKAAASARFVAGVFP